MSKYSVFKKISENDKSIIPYESNADYVITNSNYDENGVVILEGLYSKNKYKTLKN